MNEKEVWESIREAVTGQLKKGFVTEDLYGMACKYPDRFNQIGLSADGIKQLVKTREELSFCPTPAAYSVEDPYRVNYLYTNAEEPDVFIESEGEERYLTALRRYFVSEKSFIGQIEDIIRCIDEKSYLAQHNLYDMLVKNEITNMIAGLLVNKEFPVVTTQESLDNLHSLFEEYDMHDIYNMADNAVLIQWKAVLAAESRGLISKGMAERVFSNGGFDTTMLEKRIECYQRDKLRVSHAKLVTPLVGTWYSIHCQVDGQEQEDRTLTVKDTARLNPLVDSTGLAVKYFQDVLDRNREQGMAIADEKVLARMKTPHLERLVDILQNGLSKEDVTLLNLSKEMKKDPFWWEGAFRGIENESVEIQQKMAMGELVHHLSELRSDMLTDQEVIQLTYIFPKEESPQREGEANLMKLPECFFPMLEEMGGHNGGVINYVKAVRGIGRITPRTAYHSMEYFLRNRLVTGWDPKGTKDEYGRTVGCNYYPNKDMKNPAEMFPANLLSEGQWLALTNRYREEADAFIPRGAFRKDRVSDVQLYYQSNNMMIRCKLDEVQQSSRRLSITDEIRINENTDKQQLAAEYFVDAFISEAERGLGFKR